MEICNNININNIQTITSINKPTHNKNVICYRDGKNNGYGTASLVDINSNESIPESKTTFNDGDSDHISVSCLTNTKAIVCYRDYDNKRYGTACILDINNNTIIPGKNVVFNNGNSYNILINYLTNTKAVVCFKDDDNNYYGTACILNIDNNNNIIIPENKIVFNYGTTNHISINYFTDNKAIISYRNHSDRYRTICILDIQNNNILNKYQISNEIIRNVFIRKIDDNYIIICYNRNNNGICEIIKIENDNIILNKYGIIIDYDIQHIDYVSEVYDNKLNIVYNKNRKLYNQTIGVTHEHI